MIDANAAAHPIDRRRFLATALATAGALPSIARATDHAPDAAGRRPRILLRGSWQTVNIGDIGHTPGILALLERHVPEAEVRLWPSSVSRGVDELLTRRFPKLVLLDPRKPDDLASAFAECDFFLHGSGASLVAATDTARWHSETGKPFGIYGITLSTLDDRSRGVLEKARFVFFRDSKSLELVRGSGVSGPLMEFGPDAAFAVDLRNEARAEAYLESANLEVGRFLCCIPRYRFTPYWMIPNDHRKFDAAKDARNQEMKEHDHAPLRAAIETVVRETDLKILLCPEDMTQMAIGREMILDRLPADVRRRVAWREDYWLTDEALSVYARSAGVFGNEMHSPIMAVGNGVPAIVCRFAEQTSKGFMWQDIGLGDWLFDLDQESDLPRLAPTVLALAKDPGAAKARTETARKIVFRRQRETMGVLRQELGLKPEG